jgi:WD40 repeat protein/uncharacterized caspase-like protein
MRSSAVQSGAVALLLIGGSVSGNSACASTPVVMPVVGQSQGYDSISYSPDGKWIVAGAGDGTVAVWDLASGRIIRKFDSFAEGQANNVAISPDAKTVIANSGSSVRLWDLASGKTLKSLERAAVNQIAISPDWRWIASDSSSYQTLPPRYYVQLIDPASGQTTKTFFGHNDYAKHIVFSSDGRTIAAASGDKTIRVWEIASGRLLRTFRGHRADINKIAISSDGQTIVSASSDKDVKVWSAGSDTAQRTFTHEVSVGSVAINPNGNLIATGSDKAVTIWEADTGKVKWKREDISDTYDLKFSPDGQQLAAGTYENITVLDAGTGSVLGKLLGQAESANPVAFSPDGSLLISDGRVLRVWDSVEGKLAQASDEPTDLSNVLSVSPDGKLIASSSYNGISLWDRLTLRKLNKIGGEGENTSGIALTRDNKGLITVGQKAVKVRDSATGRLIRSINVSTKYSVEHLAVSSDNQTAVVSTLDTAQLYDLTTGRLVRSFPLQRGDAVYDLALSADGKLLLTGGFKTELKAAKTQWGVLKLWEVATGKLVRAIDDYQARVEVVAISPDGKSIVGVANENAIKVWDVATGRLLHTLAGNATTVKSLNFSPDGRRIAAGSNSEVKLWNVATGEPVLSFVASESGEWVAITPEGFFSASSKGADLLYLVNGFDTLSIDQFYQALYRPDLVREKSAGDLRGLVRDAAAKLDLASVIASGSAPTLRVISPVGGTNTNSLQITVEVELTDRGGGMGRIEWRVNGLTVNVETPIAPPPGQPVRLTRQLSLDAGPNNIDIVAYNGANLIASVPARITVTAPSAAPTPSVASAKPRLFVLAAGSNEYADERFRLAYAVPDARAITQAFVDSDKVLYASVEVKLLTDRDVTPEKLGAAFNELAGKVTTSDVFVVYLAGHGKTVDGRYYFVPQNFKIDGEITNKVIDDAVREQGIAQEQWQRWFASVPARKSVILFDTCESGTLAADETATKTLEQGAANDRLAQATGRSIITASSGTAVAFEGYHGHGLFTYNLLDALDRGDGDGNGTIEVSELAAFVYAQVTTISEQVFKQRQEPQIKLASNYPLTRQAHVLVDEAPVLAMDTKPVAKLAQTAQLQVRPTSGATVVRSLTAQMAVTVLKTEGGWSLVAREGKPIGYVATRDLIAVP